MILDVKNLSFSYNTEKQYRDAVLTDISFFAETGTVTAVIGPNGVGKSTLFRCILGLLKGHTGEVSIDGRMVAEMERRTLAGHIAYIPQIHRPTFGYSVMDTVLMGTTRFLSPFETPDRASIDRAERAMEIVGIRDLREKNYSNLSGGQQQLVLIARALAQDSDFLIMDEPASALDFGNRLMLLDIVRKLASEGWGVVMSTHDPQYALTFSDYTLALSPDGSFEFGKSAGIIRPELIKKLYGVNVELFSRGRSKVIIPLNEE